MAEERVRIIEGTWNCTSCDAKGILGREKKCPTCGNPREEGAESKFEFGEKNADGSMQREAATDAKALGLAAAGADWYCQFCAAGNQGDLPKCKNCGAKKPQNPLRTPPV